MKIYGPYVRNDNGRRQIVIKRDDGRMTSKSYSKHLLEQHLGRALVGEETSDHINENSSDDRIENLQVLTRIENAKKSAALGPKAETYVFACPECGIMSEKLMRHVKSNWKKGKVGPFCSRTCSGLHNQRLR